MKRVLLTLLVLALGAGSSLAFGRVGAFLAFGPDPGPGTEKVVTVARGDTFAGVARQLAQKGLVTSQQGFLLLGLATANTQNLRAGEYHLDTSSSPLRILRDMVSGRVMLHKLAIREGLTWWETARLVEAAGLGSRESFAAAVFDQEFIRRFSLIDAPNLEGYLFPETYYFHRPDDNDARPVVRRMVEEFLNQARTVWDGKLVYPENLHRIVTLASLVEKETAVASERRRIAGVFANRLERGMRLQCDPTVIYGLGTDFDGNLTRAHLRDRSNPYNTYRHAGLPPGPICSPGLEAIKAAARPEDHSYLYFVAKGDGSHKFSTNLQDHNRAVRRYQLGR
jgi:UPF0755 protein